MVLMGMADQHGVRFDRLQVGVPALLAERQTQIQKDCRFVRGQLYAGAADLPAAPMDDEFQSQINSFLFILSYWATTEVQRGLSTIFTTRR